MKKLLLVLITLAFFTGCATTPQVMRDCKDIADHPDWSVCFPLK